MASLEAAKTHQVAKASWMLRQSDILGRWKPSFCVLYQNGIFSYYKDENRRDQQGTINITKDCYAINAGAEIKTTAPPQGKDVHCLLELRSHQVNMMFCTDSIDDGQAWKSAIMEVKNSCTRPAAPPAPVAPPPYMVQPTIAAPPPYAYAPPTQQILVNPRVNTTTYTYQAPSTQYVIPPANQTVVVNGRNVIHTQRAYPLQNTVYTYPGQTYMYSSQPASAPTTVVYRL